MSQSTDKQPEKPVIRKAPAPKLHPLIPLEQLPIDPDKIRAKLAQELKIRGLLTAQDFKRKNVHSNILGALQAAFGIDSATIVALIPKEE
jgi:hypothetical protein